MVFSRNFLLRLLQALFSLLLLYLLFFLLPDWNLLLFRIVLLMIALVATAELSALYLRKGDSAAGNSVWRSCTQMPLAIMAGMGLPLSCFLLQLFFAQPYPRLGLFLMGCYMLFLGVATTQIPWRRAGSPPATFIKKLFAPNAPNRASSLYLLLLFYPGVGAAILILFSFETAALIVLPVSLLVVAIYDSSSYVWGKLLGSTNRNFFAVSPNKSAAGFIGGTLSTMALSLPLLRRFPSIFGTSLGLQILLIAALIIAATLGDLFESSIKRAAQQKDSGSFVPGRGGILDSVDSHLFAHPLFCALYVVLLRS